MKDSAGPHSTEGGGPYTIIEYGPIWSKLYLTMCPGLIFHGVNILHDTDTRPFCGAPIISWFHSFVSSCEIVSRIV